jgi:hypothetical protein
MSAGEGVQVRLDGKLWPGTGFLGRGLYGLSVIRPPEATGSVRLIWTAPDRPSEAVPPEVLFNVPGLSRGLLAEYWPNLNWEGEPLFRQVVPYLVLSWPPGQEVSPTAQFSARFSGFLRVDEAGSYSFRVVADDGARLTLDRRVIGDSLAAGHPGEFQAAVDLGPGDHAIVLDYFQAGGASGLRLYWQRGNDPWTPIPPSALTPAQP